MDGGIFAERRDPHRHDRARFEAEIDRQHARQAADHQPRAGDEDDGQGDFRGDEQLTAAPGERRSLTSTAAGERRADVRARQPERRRESEHETGQKRQPERGAEDSDVERGRCVGRERDRDVRDERVQ